MGIGFAIARRLGQDGAHVVLSSRKQANVDHAVAELQKENLSVSGLVCHVGKAEDQQRLIDTVSLWRFEAVCVWGNLFRSVHRGPLSTRI
uniref:Dehydrogenase reductase SDR member 4 n=1 Tax=Sphaerodactylus townsendi TaxID=933632 RepID=A0ACB8GD27_9SAUR